MSPKDLFTIIYYTSNREDEAFEGKVRKKLLETSGGIPIVSISQKPIDLGTNLCVGDVGACDFNLFRQIEIGCKVAQTPFVISAEADCLYPPEYFQFVPESTNQYYRFDTLYILHQWGKPAGFYKKDTAPFAQIAGRGLYLEMIKKALSGRPFWNNPKNRVRVPLFLERDWKVSHNNTPIINLKTLNGMRKYTQTSGAPLDTLPYWGSAEHLRKEIWG
jgi:hypothetical protein